jgi:hypothetical protein
MKGVIFLADFFAMDECGNHFIKYEKKKIYPFNGETVDEVIAGFAQEANIESTVYAQGSHLVKVFSAEADHLGSPEDDTVTT